MIFCYAMSSLVLVLSSAYAGTTAHNNEQENSGTPMTKVAVLEASCSNWLKQDDGSYWRTFVDDAGRQYCEVSKDGHISRVKCSVS